MPLAFPSSSSPPSSVSGADVNDLTPWDGNPSDYETGIPAFEGSGTSEQDPYLIYTAAQLNRLALLINSNLESSTYNTSEKHYKLMNDLLLNDLTHLNVWGEGIRPQNEWIPIGGDGHIFSAIFHGNGKVIHGMLIYSDDAEYQGLFGWLGSNGKIKDLGIENSSIRGKNQIGSIVGHMNPNAEVTNCYSTGKVATTNLYAGGIAGYSSGTIVDSHNAGTILSYNTAGGIVGRNDAGTITNCYNTGAVIAELSNAGGIAGESNNIITNCYNNSNIIDAMENAGGIVGFSEGTITSCYNTGNVTATNTNAGGIAGWGNAGTITNCYNTGNVTATNTNAGGIAGYTNTAIITNCYNTGNVTSFDRKGSIAGFNYGTIDYCHMLDGSAPDFAGNGIISTTCFKFNATGIVTGTIGLMTNPSLLDALNYWETSVAPAPKPSMWCDEPFPKLVDTEPICSGDVWDPTYTIDIVINGSGKVEVDLGYGYVEYNGTITAMNGTSVSIRAVPGPCNNFTTWSGLLISTNTDESFTVAGNVTLTATFTDFPVRTITIDMEEKGISGSSVEYNDGSGWDPMLTNTITVLTDVDVTFRITTTGEYVLWEDSISNNEYVVSKGDNNVTVKVIVYGDETDVSNDGKIIITVTQTGSGTIQWNNNGTMTTVSNAGYIMVNKATAVDFNVLENNVYVMWKLNTIVTFGSSYSMPGQSSDVEIIVTIYVDEDDIINKGKILITMTMDEIDGITGSTVEQDNGETWVLCCGYMILDVNETRTLRVNTNGSLVTWTHESGSITGTEYTFPGADCCGVISITVSNPTTDGDDEKDMLIDPWWLIWLFVGIFTSFIALILWKRDKEEEVIEE